ncbi:MAG: S41 family peptidase [Oscillospiraceae bacterium]|nr:S41 family peptidase [Oscillospiraceae bacterium]
MKAFHIKFLIIAHFLLLIMTLTACSNEQDEYAHNNNNDLYDIDYQIDYENNQENEPYPDEMGTEVLGPLTLDAILNKAYLRRQAIIKPDYNRLLELTERRVPTTANLHNFFTVSERADYVSISDAIADTEELFGLIHDLYGGYLYFGGSEVFGETMSNILAYLKDYGDDVISVDTFSQTIHNHLSRIIIDNHFHIEWQAVRQVSSAFYHTQDTLEFMSSEYGFRCKTTERYLVQIAEYNLNNLMHLHMNESGEFFYSPIILLTEEYLPGSLDLEFFYSDGTNEFVSFEKETPTRRNFIPPRLQHIEGIPVVAVRQMNFPESAVGDAAHARRFLSFAEELADEPIIIVDIRSNGGGYGGLPRQWLHLLTGELIPSNYISLRAWDYTDFMQSVAQSTPDNFFHISEETFIKYMNPAPFGDGYTIMDKEPPDRIVYREQVLILLVDRFSASAAEAFTDLILNMTNTLIIGSNTNGTLNFDLTFGSLWLPRSGIHFGLGTTMHVFPEGHLIEGVGIVPDIWVAGDALDATIAMLGQWR